jgi:hypothetical protein
MLLSNDSVPTNDNVTLFAKVILEVKSCHAYSHITSNIKL